jgi:hypothetical protein
MAKGAGQFNLLEAIQKNYGINEMMIKAKENK